ncbi:hypothetical protein [Nonomuraea sp. SBT364]|uniref:hypothetical protein n=1 Tax=Nonomuraea sp. SBT364 TaxID=1580530 RepID=UPI00066D63B9|nr:hypothetical protein [Nonomuraea sp. SBT364]
MATVLVLLESLLSCRVREAVRAGPGAGEGDPFGRHLDEARERRAANPTMSAAETAALDEAVALIRSLA